MNGLGVSVGRGRLKFGGGGSWNVRGCGKLENRGKIRTVYKKGWGQGLGHKGLKGKVTPHRRKLTQKSESFPWVNGREAV